MMFPQTKELSCMSALVLLFLFMLQCNGQGYKPAPNCGRLECPSYTVVHTQSEFEIRNYKDAFWVSSPTITSNSYKEAARKGFKILLDYYKGNNDAHVRINMTAPVLTIVRNTSYTVHFYVPQKYQDSLPSPVSDNVKAVKLPQHKYAAVRRFDGFLNDGSIAAQIPALKMSLKGTPYKAAAAVEEYSVAGYTRPTQIENRVNEVMLWFD